MEPSETLNRNDIGAAPDTAVRSRGRLLAAGGTVGALLASSCCIAPLLLVALGVSGAWMGSLTALAPYKLYFLSASALLLAGGFWRAYFRAGNECAGGAVCGRRDAGRITKSVLWLATILVLLSATVELWAPLLY